MSGPSLSGEAAENPAVRWSRVRSARERLAAGYYDRGPVRGSIADALIRELQQ